MIFANKSRNSSTNSAFSSSIVTNKKKNSTQKSTLQGGNASIVRLRLQSMGPVCKSRRKINSSSLQKRDEADEEANDFVNQFAMEKWPSDRNDDSCKWLSSGSSSPSCCFENKIFGNLLEFSLDDWLVSRLIFRENYSPIFSAAISFFDGSRVNPLEEEILNEESFLVEEMTSWLMNSTEAEDKFGNFFEDCKTCDSNFLLPEMWEFQEGILSSLIDLQDDENSEWISDSEMNFLQIDFPSPSYKSSSSDLVPSIDYVRDAELTELANARTDEPIFWPFVQKFGCWSSELSKDFFIMSPRRDINKLLLQNTKMEFRERHKILINSKLASANILEKKHKRRNNNNVKQTNAATNHKSTKLIRSLLEDDIVRHKIEENSIEETIIDLDKHFIFSGEDFLGVQELPIENLLGLHEFDGHEGIELEFNQDSLFMNESFKGISGTRS
ncbi:hypothetical protein ACH5RR_032075 [Cinchona calisaya]|uniref:Uncharacterized protein n=1 Tax=Cinchona calisaya TaxID=153742 RepID=A0ABD2YI51_9GENT